MNDYLSIHSVGFKKITLELRENGRLISIFSIVYLIEISPTAHLVEGHRYLESIVTNKTMTDFSLVIIIFDANSFEQFRPNIGRLAEVDHDSSLTVLFNYVLRIFKLLDSFENALLVLSNAEVTESGRIKNMELTNPDIFKL